MNINLLPTWSERSDDPFAPALPDGWQLVTHQMEVYKALQDPDVDAVFDTAMTGDGKSLAAYLPILRPHEHGFGGGAFMYPTNELIRDQERQFNDYLDQFGISLRHQSLNGSKIAKVATEDEQSKYDAIKKLLFRKQVVLTNPDIFNLVEGFAYTSPINPATLAQQFANRFSYLVFDEFHIFDAPQIASILDAMLFIRANSGEAQDTKFLFLSATPSLLLKDAFDRAGIRYCTVEGHYHHGKAPTENYRQILHAATLRLEPCEQSQGGILAWAEANVAMLRQFYEEEPESKGAIICNSVFAAKRLYTYLKEVLEPYITVGENTGLTGLDARKASFEKDLMVATSTVDVGVDFDINFLAFESLSAGTFIQRLGRLGRHEGFKRYRAIALLPAFMVERFENMFIDEQAVDRQSFFASVRETFPREQTFERYITRWGGVQVVNRVQKLKQKGGRKKHATLLSHYESKATHVFRVTSSTLQRSRDLKERNKAVSDELSSFRGAGLIDVWVYDASAQAISNVSLIRLLAGADFSLIERKKARRFAERFDVPFYPSKLSLYAEIHNYLDERERVTLRYEGEFGSDDQPLHTAADRVGFYLEARHQELLKLNRALEMTRLCTCVSLEDVAKLRRTLALPSLFDITSVIDASGAKYSVAFGQDALKLDSLLYWRKHDSYDIV